MILRGTRNRIPIRRVSGCASESGGFQSAIDFCHDTDGALKCAAMTATPKAKSKAPS